MGEGGEGRAGRGWRSMSSRPPMPFQASICLCSAWVSLARPGGVVARAGRLGLVVAAAGSAASAGGERVLLSGGSVITAPFSCKHRW